MRIAIAMFISLVLALHGGTSANAQVQAVPAASEPAKAEPFKVPSDYKRRVVKGEVKYCKQVTPTGSRFPKTMCFDEAGLKAMLEQQAQQQQDLGRAQSTCTSSSACGGG